MSSAALLVLKLAHSNADEERVFTLIKKNKTERRGSLDLNRRLSPIINVKINLDGESHQFRPSASLIKNLKAHGSISNCTGRRQHHPGTLTVIIRPVASPEGKAPATPSNHNRTEPPSSIDKTAPVLQSQNATNCKLLEKERLQQRLLQLMTASLESLLQMIIPLQPTRILIRLNREANYLVKGKVSALCFQPNKQKKKKRRQRLTRKEGKG